MNKYKNLSPEEKKEYSSFDDFLGANALTTCERCDDIVEYDEVDESGYCYKCQ